MIAPGFMEFPIYSMDVFENYYVYFGGGGGFEIPNVIQGYRLSSGKKFVDLPEVCKVETDPHSADFMLIPKNVSKDFYGILCYRLLI